MSQVLWPHQEKALNEIRAAITKGYKRICVVAPPGAGKGTLSAAILSLTVSRGGKGLFLVHLREIVKDQAKRLAKHGLDVGAIIPGAAKKPFADVQVCSIPTLVKRPNLRPDTTVIIVDECFPAGTRVDGKPIETLQPGDLVSTYNHRLNCTMKRAIVSTSRLAPKELLRICLSDESTVVCTPNHPFYNGKDYVNADTLREGDTLYASSAVFSLPQRLLRSKEVPKWQGYLFGGMSRSLFGIQTDCSQDELHGLREGNRSPQSAVGSCTSWNSVLFGQVSGRETWSYQFRHDGEDQQARRFCENEGQKPDAYKGNSGKSTGVTAQNRTQAVGSWWQWARDDSFATASRGGATRNVGTGICDLNKDGPWVGIPECVQGRFGISGIEDRSGSRRKQPLLFGETSAGPEENSILRRVGVVSVEVLQPTSDGTFGGYCPDGFVYNLEVEGEHNYFAEGILVHNCHHIVADEWSKILDTYPDAIIVGFSATPERSDGKPLAGMFDHLIVAAHYSELIATGHIVRAKLLHPTTSLDDEEDSDVVAMDPVAAYLQHTPGMKGFVFVKRVFYAHELAERFCAAGVPAEVISAKTKKRVRDKSIEKLKSGEIKLLINVATLTEGVDCPDAQLCLIVRRYRKVGPWLQATGRVLRAAEGKYFGVVLDLPGCFEKLGLPDEDREYSLDGKAITSSDQIKKKQCLGCNAMCQMSVKTCPICGYEFGTSNPGELASAPTDAAVGLVEHASSLASERTRLEPIFAQTVKAASETGAPLLWALQKFKTQHCKDGIPTSLVADIPSEVRKKAYDDCMRGMIEHALVRGRLFKFGYGGAMYHEVFSTWPKKDWCEAWKSAYSEMEIKLQGLTRW